MVATVTARRGAVVELVGAPGSGKSTLASALAAEPGICVVSGLRRAADYGVLADAWLHVPSARGVPRDPRAVRRWATRVEAFGPLMARRVPPASVAVVDQGPVYSLARIRASGAPTASPRWGDWWRSRVIAVGGLVDLIVLLDAPDDVLVDRVRAREKAHAAKDLPVPEAVAHVRSWRQSLTAVSAELLASGPVRLVRASTQTHRTPAVVEEVLAQLALARLSSR